MRQYTFTVEEVRDAYLGGLSLSQAARQFGCGMTTIVRLLDQTGTKRRATGTGDLRAISPQRDMAMKNAYMDGQTLEKIAVSYDVGVATVYRSLIRMNTTFRPRSALRLGMEERCCCTCKTPKPLTAFNHQKAMPLGRSYTCRTCVSDADLKRAHGMNRAAFSQLLLAQNYGCAICGNPQNCGRKTRLSVDHNHQTGSVRGLLCDRCNRAIGLLKDDPEVCLAAARYLLSYQGC